MSSDLLRLPEDFDGTVRLFPLPNLVLFPRVAQPLHIFEPRYRHMTADALEDDRLITMALLREGWESPVGSPPAIHDVVCIGRILEDQRLDDGRYNFLLHGLHRARIIEELPLDGLPYRRASVELVEDVPASDEEASGLRLMMASQVWPFFGMQPGAGDQYQRLIDAPIPLGGLCDIFAFALPIDVGSKQRLLAESDVVARVHLLLSYLEGAPRSGPSPARRFPPGFSAN